MRNIVPNHVPNHLTCQDFLVLQAPCILVRGIAHWAYSKPFHMFLSHSEVILFLLCKWCTLLISISNSSSSKTTADLIMSCYFLYLLALIKFIAINVFHCTLCLCMSFPHSFHFLRKRQYFNVYVHTYILSRAYNKYLRNKCKNNNSMQLFFQNFF